MVRAYLESQGIGAERVMEAVLAVDEACSNSIRHAYGGDPTQVLSLHIRSNEGEIEIALADNGAPAPAEVFEREHVTVTNREELRPGGLGVHILRAVFDEVEFYPGEERGNCVIMRLRKP
jgi:anti-sigma regulatory factor (Ser/Thr protein kinase)